MACNNNYSDEKYLFSTVLSELKALGVKVPKIKKLKSTVSKQETAISEKDCKVFGVSLGEQEWTSEAEYPLPKFIVLTTAYLQKFVKQEIGLFRKAGNIARQRNLRTKLERGEGFQDADPNDIACLLKQWLRELPESLIPGYLQDLFIRCNCLEIEKNRVSACLFTILLLPPDHMYTLKHLLRFLLSISMYSDKNKMGVHNLALIMAPNIFVTNESAEKMNNLLNDYTEIIHLLIENSDKIGEAPPSNFQQTLLGADLHASLDTLDFGPGKYKRKMSGPVQDILCGFKKLVGHNGSFNWRNNNEEHFLHTPKVPRQTLSLVNLDSPDFVTPKEKGETTKPEKKSGAHARRKSFGALFLRKKDRKKPESESSMSLSELVDKKLDREKSLPSAERSTNFSTLTDSCPSFNNLKLNSLVTEKEKEDCSSLRNQHVTRYKPRDRSDSVFKPAVSLNKPVVKYSKSCIRHVEKESEIFKTPLPPNTRNFKLKSEKREDKSIGKFGLSRQEAFSIKPSQQKSFSKEAENRNTNKENIQMKTKPVNSTCSHSQTSACNTKCDKNKSGNSERISEKRTKQEICTRSQSQSQKKNNKTTLQNSVKVSHKASVTPISPNIQETFGLTETSENMGSPSLDLSLKLLLQNFCVSPPNGSSEIKVSIGIEASNSTPELKVNLSQKETTPSDKQNSTTKSKNRTSSEQSATKTRSRLSSQSDSKIPRLKNLNRPNRPSSFSGPVNHSRRRTRRSSNERSKRHSTKIPKIQISYDTATESVNVQNESCFASPNSTSEVWIDGSSMYLSPLKSPDDEIYNKRESVSKILKENPGNVQAKVSLYNSQQSEILENKKILRAASEKYPRNHWVNKTKLCVSRSLSDQGKGHANLTQKKLVFPDFSKSTHKELNS